MTRWSGIWCRSVHEMEGTRCAETKKEKKWRSRNVWGEGG